MTDAFFVTCRDAGKTALLLGPFTTEEKCRQFAYGENCDGGNYSHHLTVLNAIHELDPKSYFYEIGMARIRDVKTDERKGVLNRVNPSWDKVLS